ncbi:MAG: BtrH N-terminal domain-containing protein [Desulfobulbaceae bacterium]|nr:BtrH N-terminal domain-containing protein [Desulfobulbaceae bacterium]
MNKIGIKTFHHKQAIHCESGVTANLLTHHGIPLSEPMAFGLGKGLSFGYYPPNIYFNKFHLLKKQPLITYRTRSGRILKNAAKCSGASVIRKKYYKPHSFLHALDILLSREEPVAVLAGLSWLPYIPKNKRFNYNEHHLVVYGLENNNYQISDPMMENTTTCSSEDLIRAVFNNDTRNNTATLSYLRFQDHNKSVLKEAREAIRTTARWLTKNPFPLCGINGIHLLSNRLTKWDTKYSLEQTTNNLKQIIIMQERIGTGGGGFRFLYSAFLQECAMMLGDEALHQSSQELIKAGERWQDFAESAASICSHGPKGSRCYNIMSDIIRECGEREENVFKTLLATC